MIRMETERSVWLFNEDNKTFMRMPKTESPPAHPGIEYTGEWEPYVDVRFPFVDGKGWTRVVVVKYHGDYGSIFTWIPPDGVVPEFTVLHS